MKIFLRKYTILLLLTCSGIVLGFTSIGKYRLSGDELLTLNIATGLGHAPLTGNTWFINSLPVDKKVFTQNDYWKRNNLSTVLQSTSSFNDTMISYNILLYYIIKLTGVNDKILIGISALFYVISILLVYFISKNLFGNSAIATLSACLFMLNPFAIHMAHNLRCYTFITTLALIASSIILKLERQNSMRFASKIAWSILLGCIYGISFLGHYFVMYIFIGHIIYALYSYFILKKNIIPSLLIAFFICFLFFMAWWLNGGSAGLKSMELNDTYILSATSAETHTSFVNIIIGTICFINAVLGYYFQYYGYRNSSFFYVIAIPLIIMGLAYWKTPMPGQDKKSRFFLYSMIVSSIVFLQLCCIKAGHISPLIWTRFGSFAAPYFMILLGYLLYQLYICKNVLLKTIAVSLLSLHLVLGFMCYPVPFEGYWFTYSDVNGDVKKERNEKIPPNPYPIIANDIMQHYTTGDTVVYNSFTISQDVNLYLRDAKYSILQEVNPLQKQDYLIKNGTQIIP